MAVVETATTKNIHPTWRIKNNLETAVNFLTLKIQTQSRRILLKSMLAAVVAGGALIACGGGNGSGDTPATAAWYGSWYAAPQSYSEPFGGATPPAKAFKDQTLRQVIYVSTGGDKVRVRVSNLLGTAPITIDSMRVAESLGGAAIRSATDTPVLFGSQNSVTVAPGAEVFSDPVALPVQPNSSLAISLYVKGEMPVATVHTLGKQNNYVASGNVVSASTLTVTESNLFYAWTTGLEVQRKDKPKVVVTFGDSITDGFGSTDDTNNRYPNFLSRRLAADSTLGPVYVVNAGISGNRWKNDMIGPKGEGRFERDVLGQPGITHTIILLGINDIGFSGSFAPDQSVTAEQIQQAIQTAVNKAKAKGVKALVGTLTPFKGTIFPGYYSEEGEAKRQAVNSFIRLNTTIDGVIDFDLAVRNPADPSSLLPAYDVGDGLHPNNAGYAAMANAIDIAKFK